MLGSLVGEPAGDESALPTPRVVDSRATVFRRLVDGTSTTPTGWPP